MPSFSPTSRKAYVELRVGKSWRHTCSSCVAKSKTGSLGETSHKPWSRCASVWNFCGRYMYSFHELFLSYFFGHGLTFFWNTLDLHVSIFLFFLFWIPLTFMCPEIFFNSPCLCNLERIAMNNMEFIFCGMEWAKCSCATPDVEVGKYMWSVRDLGHGNMKCISQRVTTIWQSSKR